MSAQSTPSTSTRPLTVLIVNPNSTGGFTESMKRHLDTLSTESSLSVSFEYFTAPESAPASIDSATTSVLSAAHCYPAVKEEILQSQSHSQVQPSSSSSRSPIDGVVVACFSAHPLVQMLRESIRIPVVGIMEAGILLGSQVGGKLGILTTDKQWEPLLEHELRGLGLLEKVPAGVKSSGLAVLDLERLPLDQVENTLISVAKGMVLEKDSDVILLGCAGMVGLDAKIQHAVGDQVTVLDPVRCGVEMCLSLARMRVKTARHGLYAAS